MIPREKLNVNEVRVDSGFLVRLGSEWTNARYRRREVLAFGRHHARRDDGRGRYCVLLGGGVNHYRTWCLLDRYGVAGYTPLET